MEQNALKCMKIIIFQLKNRREMVNSRSDKIFAYSFSIYCVSFQSLPDISVLSQNNPSSFSLRYVFFFKNDDRNIIFYRKVSNIIGELSQTHLQPFRPPPAEFHSFFKLKKKHFFSGLSMLTEIPIVERLFEIFEFN